MNDKSTDIRRALPKDSKAGFSLISTILALALLMFFYVSIFDAFFKATLSFKYQSAVRAQSNDEASSFERAIPLLLDTERQERQTDQPPIEILGTSKFELIFSNICGRLNMQLASERLASDVLSKFGLNAKNIDRFLVLRKTEEYKARFFLNQNLTIEQNKAIRWDQKRCIFNPNVSSLDIRQLVQSDNMQKMEFLKQSNFYRLAVRVKN